MQIDLQMNAGEEAALMAADLIAAGPYAARAFAVARFDQRLGKVRLHERVVVDAILRVGALDLVRVQLVRV